MPKKITDRYSLVTSMLPSGMESDGTIDLLAAFPHWGNLGNEAGRKQNVAGILIFLFFNKMITVFTLS